MKKFLLLAGVVAGGMLAVGAPAQAAAKADGCAAYAYQGTDTTICDVFPGNADRDCPDIKGKVYLVNKNNDPWKLDRDKDGIGCEGDDLKPGKTITTPEDPATGGDNSDGGKAAPVLPKTGPGDLVMPLVVGGSALALGAGAVFLVARRRVRFTA